MTPCSDQRFLLNLQIILTLFRVRCKFDLIKLNAMKRLSFLVLYIFCNQFFCNGQEDTLPKVYKSPALETNFQKPRIYRTRVTLNNYTGKVTGVLYEIKDSSVLIANSYLHRDYSSGNFNIESVDYSNIRFINTRNKNSIINRALAGIIPGVLTGALIGAIQGDDPPCSGWCLFWMSAEDKAALGGVTGAFAGFLIGGLSGLITIKIPINGDINIFNKNKEQLKKYSYRIE